MSESLVASAISDIRPACYADVRHAAFDRRWKARWSAELQVGDGRTPCVVVDMSARGAGLSIDEAPGEGQIVVLVVRDQKPISARVVWQRRGATGLCFLEQQPWILGLVANSVEQ